MSRITKIELTQQVTRLAAENAELRRLLSQARYYIEAVRPTAAAHNSKAEPLAIFFDRKTAYRGYQQKKAAGIPCHYEPMNVRRKGKMHTVFGLFIH